jgi:hypothetical protein
MIFLKVATEGATPEAFHNKAGELKLASVLYSLSTCSLGRRLGLPRRFGFQSVILGSPCCAAGFSPTCHICDAGTESPADQTPNNAPEVPQWLIRENQLEKRCFRERHIAKRTGVTGVMYYLGGRADRKDRFNRADLSTQAGQGRGQQSKWVEMASLSR